MQMIKDLFQNNTKFKLILGAIIFLAFVFAIIFAFFGNFNSPPPSQTPTIVVPTPLTYYSSQRVKNITIPQRSIIRTTPDSVISQLPNLISTKKLSEGQIQYNFAPPNEPNIAQPDQIITKNGTAYFERLNMLEDKVDGLPALSDFRKQYGTPNQELHGSGIYGPFEVLDIYASHGIAVIGNPVTDEVYEYQKFQPMTVDQYLSQFGSDFQQGTPSGESLGQ